MLLQAIEQAQSKKGGAPVQFAEIKAEIASFTSFPFLIKKLAHPGCMNLFQNDEVMVDLCGDHWSLLPC